MSIADYLDDGGDYIMDDCDGECDTCDCLDCAEHPEYKRRLRMAIDYIQNKTKQH